MGVGMGVGCCVAGSRVGFSGAVIAGVSVLLHDAPITTIAKPMLFRRFISQKVYNNPDSTFWHSSTILDSAARRMARSPCACGITFFLGPRMVVGFDAFVSCAPRATRWTTSRPTA
jgi:hypothetical protein